MVPPILSYEDLGLVQGEGWPRPIDGIHGGKIWRMRWISLKR